jgi:hypothetical protein
VNNHTAVWGSWYDVTSGTWGYACVILSSHISYCSGQAGIQAAEASSAQNLLASTSTTLNSASAVERPLKTLNEVHTDKRENKSAEKVEQNYSKKRVGEGNVKLDVESLRQAINEEKKRKSNDEDDDDRLGKRRKNMLEGGSHDVTEEELGVYLSSFRWYWKTHYLQRLTG